MKKGIKYILHPNEIPEGVSIIEFAWFYRDDN
jgi:hypothetical protein